MSSSDLRVGIIGVGTMGADHAERIARRTSRARLVAVSDADRARARQVAGRFEGVQAIPEPMDLVADPDVGAVLIASPGSVHLEQLLACLERGVPVLCEKPLTMDTESAVRVLEAERAAGRPLIQVGFMRRFDPEYAQLKEMLDSGRLGRTLLLHNTHRNREVPGSFRSEMIVRDSLVHEVDVARFVFGEEVAEITVYSPTATSVAADGVADPQVSVFRMTSGALVTNEVFVNNQVGYEVRCEAVAERGTIIAGRAWAAGIYRTAGDQDGGSWGGQFAPDFRVRFERAYDLEVQAWVDSALRGEVVGATSWDGYAATAVCSAALASLTSGQPVRVELALADRAGSQTAGYAGGGAARGGDRT